jgi:hypothetical protein
MRPIKAIVNVQVMIGEKSPLHLSSPERELEVLTPGFANYWLE